MGGFQDTSLSRGPLDPTTSMTWPSTCTPVLNQILGNYLVKKNQTQFLWLNIGENV
jgi:hypothetical protein